jgi:hypothetical protein
VSLSSAERRALAMERANQDIAGDGGSRSGSTVTWGGGVGGVLPTVPCAASSLSGGAFSFFFYLEPSL